MFATGPISPGRVKSVRIRQTEGTDGWGIKSLQLDLGDGYIPYSLNGKDEPFAVDGDDWCPWDNFKLLSKLNCCDSTKWCPLIKIV